MSEQYVIGERDEEEEHQHVHPKGTEWIIAVRDDGGYSFIRWPDIDPFFFDGPAPPAEPDSMGFPSYTKLDPGVYRIRVEYHVSIDHETGYGDDFSFSWDDEEAELLFALPEDGVPEKLETVNDMIRYIATLPPGTVQQLLNMTASLPANDAARIPQPTYGDLWDAFVAGAWEATNNQSGIKIRKDQEGTRGVQRLFDAAADAYCKKFHADKDPESFNAMEGDDGGQ